MRSERLAIVVLVSACSLGTSGVSALARPPHKKALADYLGPGVARKVNDCRTCHLPAEEGTDAFEVRPHNPFGKRLKIVRSQLKDGGKPSGILASVEAIADEDSDGDGISNLLELVTGHFPGEADDRPSSGELAEGRKALAELRRSHSNHPWNPFERVARPELPLIRSGSWVRNPIDSFIAAEHEARGLTPGPEASRPVLLRRLYLDLTGLPPGPDELHAFLDDGSPDAYEQVVDRLLASPAYGERWGRHWMDVWRYSDWAGWGKQVRDSQPHIWHWRDWIVESLNRDLSYDRMIVAMLAADEATPEDLSSLRATGYLARNFKLLSREKWMQDVVDHTGQAFLGVTLGCARCHDHMYDPILQKDYYQVRAIFEPHQVRIDRIPGVLDTAKDGIPRAYDAQLEAPTRLFVRGDDRNPTGNPLVAGIPDSLGGSFDVKPVKLPLSAISPDRREDVIRAQRNASKEALARAEVALDQLEQTSKNAEAIEVARLNVDFARAQLFAQFAVEKAESLVEKGQKDSTEWTKAAKAAFAAQRDVAVVEGRKAELAARQARGRAKAEQRAAVDKAHADALKALLRAQEAACQPTSTNYTPVPRTTYPATSTGRRLALARWITDRTNPLTARVAVNHLWGRHFGRAIVPSVNDFGRNGQRPSHPALLDWLAVELMERGWSMKAIHRLIITSATYRQDSKPAPENLAHDPDNIFVWRWMPRRAEAEAVRDCLFAVAGSLDMRMGGPSIDHQAGLTVPRRSVYFQHAAEKQMEFLQIFDGAGVTECYRRKDSILPQQALALANSDLSLRAARRLARTLSKKVGSESASFVTAAFEKVLSRGPTDTERVECLGFLGESAHTTTTPRSSTIDASDDNTPATDPAMRRRESLVHVLLNHHDFVTIR
jgi:Protein of unknown function (DUF1553)/Protein of unknown function (DUF1549)